MQRLCLLFLLVAPLAWVQVSWAQEPFPLSDEQKDRRNEPQHFTKCCGWFI